MQKLVANSNRVLTYVVTPPLVTCSPVETNQPALRTQAGGAAALLNQIQLACTFSGVAGDGGAFAGTANGAISASTPRVQGEGQSLLVQGDQVTITCTNGQSTIGSNPPKPAPASVVVTIATAGQLNVFANRP